MKSVVGSIRAKAGEAALVGPVREYLLRDFIQAHGLNRAGVFTSVVQEHQERLTDVPYALAEGVKQEWIAERWPNDMFVGRLKAAWEKWRTDFNDDGADRMQWGEQIRKLEANKSRAAKTLMALLRQKAFEMFEDSEHFGPAWAVCTLRQLRSGLNQLKQVFIREAGDANTIANALGDVYIIDAVTGGKGPSLSAVIEARSSERLALLDQAVRSSWLFNKRERVSQAAYNYLKDLRPLVPCPRRGTRAPRGSRIDGCDQPVSLRTRRGIDQPRLHAGQPRKRTRQGNAGVESKSRTARFGGHPVV